jgi:hypothetical protein
MARARSRIDSNGSKDRQAGVSVGHSMHTQPQRSAASVQEAARRQVRTPRAAAAFDSVRPLRRRQVRDGPADLHAAPAARTARHVHGRLRAALVVSLFPSMRAPPPLRRRRRSRLSDGPRRSGRCGSAGGVTAARVGLSASECESRHDQGRATLPTIFHLSMRVRTCCQRSPGARARGTAWLARLDPDLLGLRCRRRLQRVKGPTLASRPTPIG